MEGPCEKQNTVAPPQMGPVEMGNLWKLGKKMQQISNTTRMNRHKGGIGRNGESGWLKPCVHGTQFLLVPLYTISKMKSHHTSCAALMVLEERESKSVAQLRNLYKYIHFDDDTRVMNIKLSSEGLEYSKNLSPGTR